MDWKVLPRVLTIALTGVLAGVDLEILTGGKIGVLTELWTGVLNVVLTAILTPEC